MKVLITGGAGFLGSHLVDKLISEHHIVVLDDLSMGSSRNIKQYMKSDKFTFVDGNITNKHDVDKAVTGVNLVIHLAAQPDVRRSNKEPMLDFEVNVRGSMILLESLRKHDIDQFLFASSGGTVYGPNSPIPTPEDALLRPVSNYGAAKAATEMYLSSYAEQYGIKSFALRFGNIIGPRLKYGVIYDFFGKLKKDSSRLKILGDGRQEKEYVYISDVVDAICLLKDNLNKGFKPVNISSGMSLTVIQIAEIVKNHMNIPDAMLEFTDSSSGWKGDVAKTELDISVLKSYGWEPKVPIKEGVKLYIDWLKKHQYR